MVAGLFVGAVLCVSADPGMTESHRDALARYGAAVWNLRRERLLTAAKQFEAAAKQDPEATEPLKELVRLYAQLGRDPKAIAIARKVIERDPADYDTAALLARLLFDAGELREAVAVAKLGCASKSLAERPEKAVRVYRNLAAIFEKANDFAAAEDALRKAIELVTDTRTAVAFTAKEADTASADCWERLGLILVKRSKFDAAVEAFEAAAKLYADPQKADDALSAARLGWNLSSAIQAKGDPTAALKHLVEFLKLQPHAPEPYQRLAALLRAANRDEDVVPTLQNYAARDKLNRALAAVLASEMARDPLTRSDADKLFLAITSVTAEPKVIAVVVRSHLENRRAREIILDLDRSFALLEEKQKQSTNAPATAKAKSFAAEKTRAIAEALQNEPEGVAAVLRAVADDLRTGAKHAHGTHYFLGMLAAKNHNLGLATIQFRQAVLVAPMATQVDAYSSLIDAYWQAGNPSEVEKVCRDGLDTPELAIAPVFFNFHLCLAQAEQGKAAEALATAEKTILQAGDTDRLTVRLRKHLVLRILGKWDDAIDYGKKLLEEFDTAADRPKIRYAQAGAYWGAKRPAEAEAMLRAILDDDGDNAIACNDLGYHLADQGRNLDEAERLIRHAITIDRIERRKSGSVELDSAAYRDSLAWVFFRQGKLAEAKAELDKALLLHSGVSDPVVWDHFGDVLFRLGEKQKAKAAWAKAQELYEADARISSRGRRDGRLDEVKRKLTRIP